MSVRSPTRDGLSVFVRDDAEFAIRRFMKLFKTSTLRLELQDREHYVKPGEARRRKSRRAQNRTREDQR